MPTTFPQRQRRPGTLRARTAMVALTVAGLLLATTPPAAAAPAASLVGTTLLDGSGIYFVSYEGLVNAQSFQQSGILSHAGYQYAAWYRSNRGAMVARRRLPGGAWEAVELPHRLAVDDSHNVISLGISPQDGRLHVAMDTHNNPVYYVKSVAGLVTNPSGNPWTQSRFGPVQRTLDGVDLGSITYPQFVVTPQNRLQLSYRTGGSGNGVAELAEYDAGRWRRLGGWTSATGPYTRLGVTSATRNLYLHGIRYGPGGRLHVAFTWREGNAGVMCNPGGVANHDTGYVYSDDQGRTWRNNAGAPVGATGGAQRVGVASPGLVVDPLTPDHGLINQESQAVDPSGNLHVLISYVPGRFTQCVTSFAADRRRWGRAFHLYRSGAGTWRKVEIPVPLAAYGRSQLVFDAAGDAYAVLPNARIAGASRASGWSDWRLLYDGAQLSAFGEVLVDPTRVASEGLISVLYQQASSGTTPSPVRVADFRLG